MKYIVVVISIVFFCQCKGIKNASKADAREMDIYLLIGQSNMAGRAPIETQDKDSIQNVFLFTGNQDKYWEKAANPLNKYSTVRKSISMQKLGPGYGFAKEMIRLQPTKKIGLVVNARGGTSIEEWIPGGVLYNEAVKQTKIALKSGVLKGVIWHQGEANSKGYNSYMPQIEALINSLRKDLNMDDLPFVAGQLSADKPQRANFNKMILELPTVVKHTGVITTENTSTIDRTHFNSASQRLLGKRYAEEMLKLIE